MREEILDQIRDKLVELYHPETIYLFGSLVWGTPTPDSDIDIYVVVAKRKESAHQTLAQGTLWDIRAPIDLLVHTRKEFDEQRQYRSSLAYKIYAQGKKLYDAA